MPSLRDGAGRVPGIRSYRFVMETGRTQRHCGGEQEHPRPAQLLRHDRRAFRLRFNAIAAAVLGGVSLFGGRGSVLPGAVLGAVLIQTVENGLVILNANPYSNTRCLSRFRAVGAAFVRAATRNEPWRRPAGPACQSLGAGRSPNTFAPTSRTGSSCSGYPSDCGSTSAMIARFWAASVRPPGGRSAPFTRRPAVDPMACRAWSGQFRLLEI